MWLLMALLLWAPAGGQEASTKAVITLQPPWVSIFQEERVTLSCEGPHPPGHNSTQWFLNDTAIQTSSPKYSITAASVSDGGEYRCQTGGSALSDPVQLDVRRDWLLLQVSSRNLTEGEPLALRCHAWDNALLYKILFYRDGKTFRFSPQDPEFTIPHTNLSHSGSYSCSGGWTSSRTSAKVPVTVKELFPVPVLRASAPLPLQLGQAVNLSCQTALLQPPRPGWRLRFSFHVGSKTLTSGSTASEYGIARASAGDSGAYWCEAATEDGRVRKLSAQLELLMLVSGPQSPISTWFHAIFYLAVGVMYLVDTIFCAMLYKELQKMKIWTLEISLGNGKKAMSDLEKDTHYEELDCQKQKEELPEKPQEQSPQEEAQVSGCQ